MQICPRCGRLMEFQMEYCCGEPYVFYTCKCGYRCPNNDVRCTVTTEVDDGQIIQQINIMPNMEVK